MKKIIIVLFSIISSNLFAKDCIFSVKNADKIEIYSSSFTLNGGGSISASFDGINANYTRDLTKQLEILTITMPDGASASPTGTLDLLPNLSLIFVSSSGTEASLICTNH